MNQKQWAVVSALGVMLLGGGQTSALGQDFHSKLTGYQEVPAVSTIGRGTFFLRNTGPFFSELLYDLEGEIIQAHIHLGQTGVNGGVMVWLCANPLFDLNPPPETPACTGRSGIVSRALTADDVVGPSGQGVEPGQGVEALLAIRAGVAYVNVHSTFFESGEIRGQLKLDGFGEDSEDLRAELNELRRDFEGHTHRYLTGRGEGHNNTEATSGPPQF